MVSVPNSQENTTQSIRHQDGRLGGATSENVIGEGIVLQSKQDKVAPLIVVRGQKIVNDRHKGAGVLKNHDLSMEAASKEAGNGGSFKGGGGVDITGSIINRTTAIQ